MKNTDANVTKQIAAWKALLHKCTIDIEERKAFELLMSNNTKFKLLLENNPLNFDLLWLTTMTASIPLAYRKQAAQTLFTNFPTNKELPPAIGMAQNWNAYKHKVPGELQEFVGLAIQNTISAETLGMKANERFKISGPLATKNTVVIYIQPRFFLQGNSSFEISYMNTQKMFQTILKVLSVSRTIIIPHVLPHTNLLPKNDYPNLLKIGHHTLGNYEKTLHQKIAYLSDYSYLDQCGYGPFSKILPHEQLMSLIKKVDQRKADKIRKQLFERYCLNRTSKFKQENQKFIVDEPATTYFFAMQTINDTVARRAKINQFKGIKLILEQFINTQNKLIIKPHPLDQSSTTVKFLSKIKKHSNAIISNSNIHDLISQTKATICVNSGVGIEALIHLKPVISLGESDYQTATYKAETEAELFALLERTYLKVDKIFISKFLYYFFKEHVCEITDELAISKRLRALGLSQ
ncbi:hypothetical protein OAP82_11200 [Paracoccaceae bacterium]|nr:hypothetical protein [Paracoccaceae bacterium]